MMGTKVLVIHVKLLFLQKNVMTLRNYILLTCFLMCCVWSTIGQHNNTAETTDTIELDPSVRYGQLKNGFTYYIRHNNEPKNEVHFQMVVKAGSFHEDSLQTEYAHLLEHMGGTGTLHFPELRKHIRNLNGYNNASTSNLFTCYWMRSSSKNQKLSKDGLQIIRDWSQGIELDSTSIDVERGAVLGEMRMGNPYSEWLHGVIKTTIEQNSNFQKKDKSKLASSNIRNFNKDAFVRFYKEWYRPDLQAAIIVGDINVDSIETKIKRLFANLQMQENPKDASLPVLKHNIKLDGHNRFKTIIDTIFDRPRPFVYIFPKRTNPGYSPKTRYDFKNLLVQKVYQEIALTRVGNMNKQYRPLFSLAPKRYANQQLYTMGISMSFYETTLPKMRAEFLKSMSVLRGVNSEFTEDELKNGKEMVRQAYIENKFYETKALAVKYRNHFVLGTAAPPPALEKQLVNDLLDEINLNDVHKAAAHYGDLSSNTDFIFFAGPDTSTPDSTMIGNWLSEVSTMEVEPYKSIPSIPSLKGVLDLPAISPNAVRNITQNRIGVTTVDLANGVKLLLKPTDNSKFVKIRASRPNIVPLSNREEYLAAALSPRAIQFSGAGPYTKFQLSDFTGIDVQLQQRLERTEQIITGRTRSNRVEDFFQLLYLYTQQPRQDKEAFQSWIGHEKRLIKQGHPNRNMFFSSVIDHIRYPELPLPNVDDLDQLSIDSIYTAYHRWYSNFEGYTFVITGNFDVDTLLPILIKYVAVLPGNNNSDSIEREIPIIPLKKVNEIRHISNINEAFVYLHFPVMAPTDTKTKVLVSLLSNALYSRIWDRLRKGTYSPGARVDLIDYRRGIYNFQVWFDVEIGKQDILIQWALDEYRELRESGVTEEWFKKNLNKHISNYDSRFSNSAFWNNYLSEKVRSGENLTTEILEYETFLKQFITLEDFNNAAKELLSEKYLQKFIFLPKTTDGDSKSNTHTIHKK